MAEQVSFYDKLKSDMGEEISEAETRRKREAAARFATDYELGADRPTLVKSLQRRVQEVADSDLPGGTKTLSARLDANRLVKQLNELERRLNSPDARLDSSYRARLIDERNRVANDVRKLDLLGGQSTVGSEIGFQSNLLEADRALEERDPYGPSRRRTALAPGGDSPYAQARRAERDAVAAFDAIDTRNPSPETDRALNEAMNRIKEANVASGEIAQRLSEDQRARIRAKRMPPAGEQLDLYRRAKQAAESYGTEAVSAAKKALGSPALKRGLAVGAGILGSKAGMAATSGGADLVAELAVGVPKAFIEGYNRSQEPYEQVKYVAEAQGPIDKLQPKTLSALGYSDALRLRDEGHLTSGAVEQLRQHVMREEGFDPQRVLRDMDRSVVPPTAPK